MKVDVWFVETVATQSVDKSLKQFFCLFNANRKTVFFLENYCKIELKYIKFILYKEISTCILYIYNFCFGI